MADINISIREGKTSFRPGATIEGSVNWNLGIAPQSIETRLMWQTRGKGTLDASIVESTKVAAPAPMGDAPFRFTLPEAPYTFAGQLIALAWVIEVVAVMGRNKHQSETLEFDLLPSDAPIVLGRIEMPKSRLELRKAQKNSSLGSGSGFDSK